MVVSPVKTWKAAWGEVERFEADTVDMGPRSRIPVVRVIYRDGFGAAHEAASLAGKVLGIDEHYVPPGYGQPRQRAARRAARAIPEPIRRVSELTGRLPLELRPTVARRWGGVAAILWP